MLLEPSASFFSHFCGFPSCCDQHAQECLTSCFCASTSRSVREEYGLGVQLGCWNNFNHSNLKAPSGVWYWPLYATTGPISPKICLFPLRFNAGKEHLEVLSCYFHQSNLRVCNGWSYRHLPFQSLLFHLHRAGFLFVNILHLKYWFQLHQQLSHFDPTVNGKKFTGMDSAVLPIMSNFGLQQG